MYLKRLEIQGFKTFAEKTDIGFATGVTAIIGPNGSGKSNIADAVLWVLGENNVRSLRGQCAQDVIFAGNDLRRPLGMAEVALTIDNSTRILPLDFSEITVTRRVFRSGESECFINRVPCRLRDIYELFLDTGMGRDAYSMVNQGEIDSILSARPEERRALFEEAAGIKKYRHRKREAERKLETTRQNLLRLTDILSEVENRLGPLARQASAAQRFHEVASRLQALETAWYGQCLSRLETVEADLRGRRWKQGEDRAALEARIAATRATEEEARCALAELDRDIELMRRREAEGLGRLAELSAVRARAEERQQQRELRLSLVRKEIDGLGALSARREDELRAAQAGADTTRRELATTQAALDRARGEASRLQGDRDRAESGLSELRRAAMQRLRLQSEAEGRRLAAQGRAERAGDIVDRLEREQAEAEKGRAELRAALEAASARHDNWRAGQAELGPRVEAAAAALAAARMASTAGQQEVEAAHRELGALTGRLQVLLQMEEQGSGASEGARALVGAARTGEIDGDWCLLAEAIRVPANLARAVEAALGPYVDAVIAPSVAGALQALAWLRERGLTALLFAPGIGGAAPPPGSLAAQVEATGRAAGALRALLGDVELCDRLPPAVPSPAGGTRLWVTPGGEWLSASGAVCGGAEPPDRALAATQARRREIERLEADIARLRQCADELERQSARREDEVAALQAADQEVARELARLRAEADASRREVDRLTQDASRHEQQSQQLRTEIAKAREDGRLAQAGLATLPAEDPGRSDGDPEAAAASAAADASQLQEEVRRSEERVADLRVQAASLEREAAARENERRRLVESIGEIEAEIRGRSAEKERLEREPALSPPAADGESDEPARIEAGLEALRADLHAAAGRRQERSQTQLQEGQNLRCQEADLRADLEREHGLELESAALNAERRRLEEQWLETAAILDAQPGDEDSGGDEPAEAAPPAANGTGVHRLLAEWDAEAARRSLAPYADPEQEIRRLRRQVRNMGAINPEAPEEFERQSERARFLGEQKADLELAGEQLVAAIRDIDESSKETFQRAFTQISIAFDEMFRKLFGGGSTELRLTDPEDVLETGIDIMVQPPGKRRQNLLLLSGGERALTAAAMLFALLKIRPSPFCVLDEIDAPLDESNIHRFGETLKEFARDTQFIIVTHNRGTMEAADTLYGVTMEERGVSRVLACRLTDDMAAAPREAGPELIPA